ncbi:MAG: C10 family peptidase [Bacteroidales bacterium]|nr:C10 family peptidase [Bacteroidales bacterium]
MKRIILTVFLVFAAAAVSGAKVVTEKEAMQYAAGYFSGTPVPVYTESFSDRTLEAPAFHIFNNMDGGWVIISGDDTTVPVLAYGEGEFRTFNMPDNLKYWLSLVENKVARLREAGISPSSVPATATGSGVLLQTGEWDQGDPYNLFCPIVTGEKKQSITGCVATAMAIVLRYNEWPEYAVGQIGGYTTHTARYKVEKFSIDGFHYDYSKMPLKSASSSRWTQDEKEAVAHLMHHCGVMVEMDYSNSGSGAYSEDIPSALIEHMSYCNCAKYSGKASYSATEWIKLLKAELDARRPILYSGNDGKLGHQFVFDGYDDKDCFHVNWGWSGYGNGYFAVNMLGNYDDVGYVFNNGQGAVLNLVPNKTGLDSFIAIEAPVDEAGGISVASGAVCDGKEFALDVNSLKNMGGVFCKTLKVKVAHTDIEGNVKEFVSDEVNVGSISSGVGKKLSGISCKLGQKAVLGDRLELWYMTEYTEDWCKVQPIRETAICNTIGVYDALAIDCPDKFTAGESFTFNLILGHKPVMSYDCYVDDKAAIAHKTVLSSGKHTLRIDATMPDGSIDSVYKIIEVE